MKIEFPKIVQSFSLSEYAEEIKGVIYVWVNPPQKKLEELLDVFGVYLKSEGKENFDEFTMMVSDLLSQGESDTHWSADELKELYEGTKETDPAFWIWFNNKILNMISNHRLGIKKN